MRGFLSLGIVAACLTARAVATPTPFGAYDPVFTPFHANGTLNTGAIASYANFTHSLHEKLLVMPLTVIISQTWEFRQNAMGVSH